MKLITRNTDYAVRVLCYITKNKDKNKVISARDMVRELNMPRPFLRKILQILQKRGILNSFKGQGGGFSLAVLPKDIYLVDLIEIFQGPIKLNECILKKNICPDRSSCTLKFKIDKIEKNVLSDLKSITIESLL